MEVDLDNFFKGQTIEKPFGIENETRVWKKVGMLVDEALSKYPTSYEEDLDILKEEKRSLSQNERNCVTFRSEEKKIYRFFKLCSTRFLNLL